MVKVARALVLVASLLLPQAFAGAAPQAARPDAERAASDLTQGTAIARGFVFRNGAYVRPPYVVSRRKLGVFINDVKLQTETTRVGDSPVAVVTQRLDHRCGVRTERRLQADSCYIFAADGGEVCLGPYIAAYALPSVVEVLRSRLPAEGKISVVEDCGWQYTLSKDALQVLATSFSAPPEFGRRLEALARELLREEEFGSSVGTPVDGGFLFVNGRYVDAPYTVARAGLGVLVNGQIVAPPAEWPLPPVPSGDTDPELPDAITRETSLYDDVLNDYLAAKFAYARAHHGREEESDVMEKAMRSLPCVEEALLDEQDPTVLHVTTFRGETSAMSLVSLGRGPADRTPESVLERAEAARRQWERQLSEGRCLLIYAHGRRVSLSADELRPVVAVLRSSETGEVKIRKLKDDLVGDLGPDAIAGLVVGFRPSQQLDRRMAELQAQASP